MRKATAKDYWGDGIEAKKDKETQRIVLEINPCRKTFSVGHILVCLSPGKARRFFESGVKMCKELEENK